MSKRRQVFPYQKGTSIWVSAQTLNFLAQVRAPGETWDTCLLRIVARWAIDHAIALVESPTLENGLRTRQAAATVPLYQEGESEHGSDK